MQLTARYLSALNREVDRTRRALTASPEGHGDWTPHPKSMAFGQLVWLVATIPSWVTTMVMQDELDVAAATPRNQPDPVHTQAAWLAALDAGATSARQALGTTTDAHLETVWTLKAHGDAVGVMARADMIADTFAHWAHHRGQLTVYLRLLGATVPALYGPSADDPRWM